MEWLHDWSEGTEIAVSGRTEWQARQPDSETVAPAAEPHYLPFNSLCSLSSHRLAALVCVWPIICRAGLLCVLVGCSVAQADGRWTGEVGEPQIPPKPSQGGTGLWLKMGQAVSLLVLGIGRVRARERE